MTTWLPYLVDLIIYTMRSLVLTNVVLTFWPVRAAARIAFGARHLHGAKLVDIMQPFSLRLLLAGLLTAMAGWTFGATTFIVLDIGFIARFGTSVGDFAVAITWTFWAVATTMIAAAFARRPAAIYRGAAVMLFGLLLLGGLTGRFG